MLCSGIKMAFRIMECIFLNFRIYFYLLLIVASLISAAWEGVDIVMYWSFSFFLEHLQSWTVLCWTFFLSPLDSSSEPQWGLLLQQWIFQIQLRPKGTSPGTWAGRKRHTQRLNNQLRVCNGTRFVLFKQQCVRGRAVRSILAVRKVSREEAQKIVDEVFDSCFNDHAPFGRIPHGNKDAKFAYREYMNRDRYYANL